MIDILTRLKVHDMAENGALQATIADRWGIGVRSVQRIVTEPVPTVAEVAANQREAGPRRGRPPKFDAGLVERVRLALMEDPTVMATELLRRSRAWGYDGGKSALSALVKRMRPSPKLEPIVRFDGLPGEYAQFDFGEVLVKLENGRREKFIFFAGRLKYSRFMHVTLVPNQTSESVVRGLLECLEAFGGSPKEWVFDNAKSIRLSPWGVEPVVLHRHLRDLVAEYRVIPTFCAPRSGNQKGTVERLVGFSKNSFFLARPFKDRADVQNQLTEWLREVNCERPSSATGVVPEIARQDELRWLRQRPLRRTAEEHPLRGTATITPTGTVSWAGTPYFVSARHIGGQATLLIRRHVIEFSVSGGAHRCTHARRDGQREVQRLPHQREDMLEVLHGRRKRATFRRQCLIELGKPARDFLGTLVHICADGSWEQPCTELYDLMRQHGDEAMRRALGRCVRRDRYTVAAVADALREAA